LSSHVPVTSSVLRCENFVKKTSIFILVDRDPAE
jgi:hypothetical protein